MECLVESDQWRALVIAVEADDRIGLNLNEAKSTNLFLVLPNDLKLFKVITYYMSSTYNSRYSVITKDLIRNVVVPSKEKTPAPICISKSTIDSVRQKSKVRTRQAIQKEFEDARIGAENALAAAAQRKLKFEEIDLRKQVKYSMYTLSSLFYRKMLS